MKQQLLKILSICSVILLVAGNAFADTDSETYSDGGDWWELDSQDREDNQLGLEPPETDDKSKFSYQDCIDDIEVDLSFQLIGNRVDWRGTAYLMVGDDCDEDNEFGTDDCYEIASSDANSSTVSFVNLPISQVFSDIDCDGETKKRTVRLWFALLDSADVYNPDGDDGDRLAKLQTPFSISLESPSTTVAISDVLVGNNNIEVEFNSSTSSAVKGYAAFYVEGSGANCTGGSLVANDLPNPALVTGTKQRATSDAESIHIGGLTNGTGYQVAISTLDAYGNPSVMSAPVCGVPAQSVGIGDALDTDGEFCFIATAAFDSYEHPTVRVLRSFRDQFLRDLPFGDALIAGYYSVGPSLAAVVQADVGTKASVQSALGLFAGLSRYLVQIGAFGFTIGIGSAILLGLIFGFAVPRGKER